METKKVLLMYISNVSGHRCASLAIEKALQQTDGNVQTHSIDTLSYTNPCLERLINKLYMFTIKAMPRLWDYLYDNEKVLRKVKKIRALIHRLDERKIKRLFEQLKPDIVICTQAFPCGMVADYKHRRNQNIPLVGVLTDYAPHVYWLNELVDIYVVPAAEIKQRLMQRGVSNQRLKVLGIPIDNKFGEQTDREEIFRRLGLDADLPVILIMGGGQGLGPIKEIMQALDKLSRPAQLIVVSGTNRKLYSWLKNNKPNFTKPVFIMGYTEQINDLMAISSFIITKPGGLTSAEALSKLLPIIIVKPLPGQESLNTQFLLEAGVAQKVNSFIELRSLAEELLSNSTKLAQLREKAKTFGQPDSAIKIAQLILSILKK